MKPVLWLFLLGGLLIWPKLAAAQAEEVFRTSDLVGPFEHRKSDSGEGIAPLIVSRAYLGVDSHYSYRNDFFSKKPAFARLANNFYFSRFQLNGNFVKYSHETTDQSVNGSGIPDFRVGMEVSIYEMADDPGRYRFIWNASRYSSSKRTIHEFGIAIDVKDTTEAPFVGGFFYSWKPSQHKHTFGMKVDYDLFRESSGFAATLGFEVSGVYEHRIGGIARLPQPNLRFPLGPRGYYLYAFYSPALSFRKPQGTDHNKRLTHEAGVYLSLPVFVHLFE